MPAYSAHELESSFFHIKKHLIKNQFKSGAFLHVYNQQLYYTHPGQYIDDLDAGHRLLLGGHPDLSMKTRQYHSLFLVVGAGLPLHGRSHLR